MNIAPSHVIAFQQRVPRAETILQDIVSLEETDEPFAPTDAEIVVKEGISLSFYAKAKAWLDETEERRLFWIENCPERLARLREGDSALQLLQDLRVHIFYIETLLDQELALQKIAWLCAFKKVNILAPTWQVALENKLLAVQLITADSTDFGVSVARHAKANLRKPMRRLSALEGQMKGVPAIVVGAGPSLEKNGHLLEAWQDRALLITAGNAIHSIPTRPSLAVALDPHESLRNSQYPDVPMCIQGRTHPNTRECISGEVLYFPDSHYAFEPWLMGEECLDTGWTVGNGAVAVALKLGCNPIIFVGMDFCYRGTQKYAWSEKKGDMALVRAQDSQGQEVWTQTDWLMSVRWMEQTAAAHPEVTFLNATEEGIAMSLPIQMARFPDPPNVTGVQDKWAACVQNAPLVALEVEPLRRWTDSLKACRWNWEAEDESTEGEIAKELLLEPLWKIWGPLFERELMTDLQPIPFEEKLELQKRLFFNRVIEEHLAQMD